MGGGNLPPAVWSSSVELDLEITDALLDEPVGDRAFGGLAQHFFRGGYGRFSSRRSHIGERLAFGLSNLKFRHAGAPRDKFFHSGSGLLGHAFGFGSGTANDGIGLLQGLLALALILGE